MMPCVCPNLTGIGAPSASRGGLMSNTCSTDTTVMNSESSAKYRPGQILSTTRSQCLGLLLGKDSDGGCLPPSEPEGNRI